jgi:deoxyadenosine/deoxycytidine kinase
MKSGARVVVVSLDASIGAGKTTLLGRLMAPGVLPCAALCADEPVQQWMASGLFREMYDALQRPQPDPNGMPGMFQVYAFATRIGRLATVLRDAEAQATSAGAPVIVFTERSPYTDRAVFAHMLTEAGHITDVQRRVYDGCFAAWEQVFTPGRIQLALWLDTDVPTCMARAKARGRAGEAFDATYAAALDARHRELFDGNLAFGTTPVLRIDGAAPFHTDDAALGAIADQIVAKLAL